MKRFTTLAVLVLDYIFSQVEPTVVNEILIRLKPNG